MATKNTINTTLKVDITDFESPVDVYAAFAVAKMDNCFTVTEKNAYFATETEAKEIIGNAIVSGMESIKSLIEASIPTKKPNIFKRFWNWIRRK